MKEYNHMNIENRDFFRWWRVEIRLVLCKLEEKNLDWLNAEIVYRDNSDEVINTLVSGYSVVSRWVRDLDNFLQNLAEEKIELNLSSVLNIRINKADSERYAVNIEMGEDPLLEIVRFESECLVDDVEDLLSECRILTKKYKEMIGEE